ncbi:MAG: cell surface protein [Bauldia sp.]|nr:cell surface protein [Bauldia sp.]MCW5717990.1 cell surface protein [Bauldia sp.]
MAQTTVPSPMQYLDKAMGALRSMGLLPEKTEEAPITHLLEQISDLDKDRVVVITRTLSQMSTFNDVVREQIAAMTIGQRYEKIASAFDSIREDAKTMVDQLEDGKISFTEKMANMWTKVRRGDIADRFDDIRKNYLDVARDTRVQIEREHKILEAYRDFRGAMKQAEVLAFEVLKTAEGRLDEEKRSLSDKSAAAAAATEADAAERSRLELTRDEALRAVQDMEKRYQIAKDLSDNLTVGYNTSEVVMARLMQTTNAKERVYAQAVSFFSTNETVLTALKASFTGLSGLHEATQSVEAMKEGMSKSLETLSEIGDKVQEAALRAGYGPTIRADAVKKLVDSVVSFQDKSRQIIAEMRTLSTKNAEEIREAVEDGKRRLAQLDSEAAALPPPAPAAIAPPAPAV